MTVDLVEYLSDGISRVEAGGIASPSGSWLAGMYGKAANLFEKEMSRRAAAVLAACGLKYPEDLGEAVKGTPPYEKLTFGPTRCRDSRSRQAAPGDRSSGGSRSSATQPFSRRSPEGQLCVG